MPSTARQSQPLGGDADWLPLDEAVPLLGGHAGHLRRRAQGEWSQQGLAVLRPARHGKGRPTWWVHRRIDARLSADPRAAEAERNRLALTERYPARHVDSAYRKSAWVERWRDLVCELGGDGFTDKELGARVVAEARQAEGVDARISVRSLYLWRAAMARGGVAALVPRYGDGDGSGGPTTRSPEAIAFFYQQYRTALRAKIAYCHRATGRAAIANQWSWPSSLSATRVWLRDYDDLSLTFLCRWGRREWSKRFMPYLEQDWEQVAVGQFYVTDHTQCDFWVRYKDTQIRPWLTAVQDCRSRRIVGWRLGPAPHQDAILMALRMAFRHAIPEVLRIDNGRDFKSKPITGLDKTEIRRLYEEFGSEWRAARVRYNAALHCDDIRWRGIAAELGVKLIYALPYHAWSKGTIERFFGTFEDNVARSFATYTGNDPSTRPESLQIIREGYTGRSTPLPLPRGDAEGSLSVRSDDAIPTMDQARETFAAWLTVYDHTPHQGVGIDGRTPMEVWNSAQSLRNADDAGLDFLLSIRGTYKVGPNGVGIQIGGKRWGFGARSQALRPWVGREVLVGHDPETPTRAVAFDPKNRRLIAALDLNERINPLADIDTMREASAVVTRSRKGLRNSATNAAKAAMTASQVANADLHAQAEALRATGTDDASPLGKGGSQGGPNIRPVQTGFEGVSIPDQQGMEAHLASTSADALQRLSAFAKKKEPAATEKKTAWSRLSSFARGSGNGR